VNHAGLIIPTLDRIGGAERQVMLLAAGLRARGWRVSVITLSGAGGAAAAELTCAGVEFLSLEMCKGLADPRGWFRFNRWLRRERPDIVHAHLPHAAWLARWSRLAAPVSVLVDTIHTSATGTIGRRAGYLLSRWLPDRVTAVSAGVRDAWIAAGMTSSEQCIVISNGVDTGVWLPDEAVRVARRSELGLGHEFLWFAAGRLEPVKDYATMLRAFAQTPRRGRLVIAGSGPLQAELHRLASALEIADRVRFLGFEPAVRQWMQTADAFLLSSLWEGLPMGPIEAAACGLPAVATDVPGTGEVIVDGQTGFLAPAGDPGSLAARMRALMQLFPEERKAMGDRARRRANELFSLSAVLDRWEQLYRELLDRNPYPRRWSAKT
jgi:glycosyltransferase involved in cell wall biosynthesis